MLIVLELSIKSDTCGIIRMTMNHMATRESSASRINTSCTLFPLPLNGVFTSKANRMHLVDAVKDASVRKSSRTVGARRHFRHDGKISDLRTLTAYVFPQERIAVIA